MRDLDGAAGRVFWVFVLVVTMLLMAAVFHYTGLTTNAASQPAAGAEAAGN